MVNIPAGNFVMGNDNGDSNEKPAHQVWLEAYAIDKFEVTNKSFEVCVRSKTCYEPGGRYYLDEEYQEHPVVYIDWFQANAYCTWRGKRLPTEAEWEHAARGYLVNKAYPWGNQKPLCDLSSPYGAQYYDCGEKMMPVGSFTANGFGLFDMAGNVWEWVNDRYAENYNDEETTNPIGPAYGMMVVVRGGGWESGILDLRVSKRAAWDPNYRDYTIGFRCAASSPVD